jgi:hypothetical protein
MNLLLLILFTFIGLCIYFLPAIIAEKRHHHNILAIFWLNFFLGWSLLGWVISLVWACTALKHKNTTDTDQNTGSSHRLKTSTILKYVTIIMLFTTIIVFLCNYKLLANRIEINHTFTQQFVYIVTVLLDNVYI